jgi:hypothetical protein
MAEAPVSRYAMLIFFARVPHEYDTTKFKCPREPEGHGSIASASGGER